MAQQSSMTKSGKVSKGIAIIGWILLGFAIILFFEANKRGAGVGFMGPSLQDLLIPFAQLVGRLAGFVWLIAFIIGLIDYVGSRRRMPENKKIARPYGPILSGIGLAVLVGLNVLVFQPWLANN